MTGEVNTWVAGSAGNWDVAENWSLGHVPTSTEVATFDNTSDNNCAINAAPDVYGINLATGYDGTVTQGAVDITIGVGGYAQAAGTFTGNGGKTVTCAGNVTKTGGTLTNFKTCLSMSGVGKSISLNSSVSFVKLTVSGSITTSGSVIGIGRDGTNWGVLTVTGTLTLGASGMSLSFSNAADDLSNTGEINGAGTLRISSYLNKSITFGNVQCPVAILKAPGDATGSRTVTLGANTVFGSSLAIDSVHASYTMTLDMAGKTLSATAITVGTRGNVLWGSGVHRIGGTLDTSAGSSNFGTSQIIMTNGGIIKTGAGQTLYDLMAEAPITLGSNITVSGVFAHVGDVAQGAYGITMNRPEDEYSGLRRPIAKAIRQNRTMGLAAYPLMADLERAG